RQDAGWGVKQLQFQPPEQHQGENERDALPGQVRQQVRFQGHELEPGPVRLERHDAGLLPVTVASRFSGRFGDGYRAAEKRDAGRETEAVAESGAGGSGVTAGLIDTHVHLNSRDLGHDLAGVLARAEAAGVHRFVVVGYDLASSERAVRLAEEDPRL